MEGIIISIVSLVGVTVTVLVPALANRSLRNREAKIDEVIEAFDNRGRLVESLRERVENIESQFASCKEQLQEATQMARRSEQELEKLRRGLGFRG